MIYSFIKNNQQLFPIEKMCKVLQMNSGNYYRWKKTSNYSKTTTKNYDKRIDNIDLFWSQTKIWKP